jgi:hypothetical protein
MKLNEFSSEMLLRAIDVYVAVAYADTHVPLSVKARASFDPRMGFKSLISHEVFDCTHLADRPDVLDECRLRLGNAKYPHMKLVLKRLGDDDYGFAIDTHDDHFQLADCGLDAIPAHELKAFNHRVREEILARWRDAGLPVAVNSHA